MKPDTLTATAEIGAPESDVFDVLANPSTHAAIDGTGWVREPVDGDRLDHVGQVFKMGMYHENHPDKHYEMANRVEVFDRPSAISWQPGQFSADTGELELGGWTWRYDLAPAGIRFHQGHTDVRLVRSYRRDTRRDPVPALRATAPRQLTRALGTARDRASMTTTGQRPMCTNRRIEDRRAFDDRGR